MSEASYEAYLDHGATDDECFCDDTPNCPCQCDVCPCLEDPE